jgi:hypothetical protein
MKTILFFQEKFKTVFAVALIVLSFTSCVSYQSTTQDEDGIYGTSRARRVYVDNSGQEYKEYFKDLKADNAHIFTDVDKYSTYKDSTKVKTNTQVTEYQTQAYPAWGSNGSDVNITIVDNSWGWNNWGWNGGWGIGWNNWGWNNWGWNGGWGFGWNNWGWNNCWNCGWGWNNWGWGGGWGWNNWGWNNGWGYQNAYFANGRRGDIRDGYYGNNYQGRNAQNQQGRTSARNSEYSTRSARATLPSTRGYSENGTRRQSGTRSYDSNDSSTRSQSSGTRSYDGNSSSTRSSSGSTRTYSPSYSPAPSRSSSSGSYGGSRSFGGSSGGGGRSSGGGGGRRG